jgi:hypothetical protein
MTHIWHGSTDAGVSYTAPFFTDGINGSFPSNTKLENTSGVAYTSLTYNYLSSDTVEVFFVLTSDASSDAGGFFGESAATSDFGGAAANGVPGASPQHAWADYEEWHFSSGRAC